MKRTNRLRAYRKRLGVLAGLAVVVALGISSIAQSTPVIPVAPQPTGFFEGNINSCSTGKFSVEAVLGLAGPWTGANSGSWGNDVTGWPVISGGGLTVTISGITTVGDQLFFDWSSNLPVDLAVVKQGSGGAYWLFDPSQTSGTLASWNDQEPSNGVSHVLFCAKPPREIDPSLGVEKTAEGWWQRDNEWSVFKSHTPDGDLALGHDGSGGVEWFVDVTKTSSSHGKVSGTITLEANDGDINNVQITDSLGDFESLDCTLDDEPVQPVDGEYSIPEDSILECAYVVLVSEPTPGEYSNTVTVWQGDTIIGEASSGYGFGETPNVELNASVEVVEQSFKSSWTANGGSEDDATFPQEFTCPDDEGNHVNRVVLLGDNVQTEEAETDFELAVAEDDLDVTCGEVPNDPPPTITTKSTPKIDIQVTKTGPSAPVTIGQQIVWTIVVKNNGPDTATGVLLTEQIPAGLTVISASPTQGVCNQTTAACDIGNLLAGASSTVTVRTTSGSAVGALTNAVIVTAGNETGTKENNVSSAPASVVAPPFTPPTAKPKPKVKAKVKPAVCTIVSIARKSVAAGKKSKVTVKLTAAGEPVRGAKLRFLGAGINKVVRSNKSGVATTMLTARRAGIITITVIGKKACTTQRLGVIGSFEPPVTG